MTSWLSRTVLTLVVVLLSAVWVAPARAGGPTSVLLSAPNIPKVAAAGYEEPAYRDLLKLVTAPAGDEGSQQEHAIGNFVRATWLIHDKAIWRMDVIYLYAPGGPWIATTEDSDRTGQLGAKPTWHKATDRDSLIQLLDSLGLNGSGATGQPTTAPETTIAAGSQSVADQPPATAQAVNADQGALSGWRWSIPGFLLGAVIAVVAIRLVPRRRPWDSSMRSERGRGVYPVLGFDECDVSLCG
jgi:hypothetical protein